MRYFISKIMLFFLEPLFEKYKNNFLLNNICELKIHKLFLVCRQTPILKLISFNFINYGGCLKRRTVGRLPISKILLIIGRKIKKGKILKTITN